MYQSLLVPQTFPTTGKRHRWQIRFIYYAVVMT